MKIPNLFNHFESHLKTKNFFRFIFSFFWLLIFVFNGFAEINITNCEPMITISGSGIYNISAIDVFGNRFFKSDVNLTNGLTIDGLKGKVNLMFIDVKNASNIMNYTTYVLSDLNINLEQPSEDSYYVNLPIKATITDAIKTAYLQINDLVFELPFSYLSNNSIIDTTKTFSLDFKDPQLVVKDFCDQTAILPLHLSYHKDKPWVKIETDKEAYSILDTMTITIKSNHDFVQLMLEANNQTLFQETEYLENYTKEVDIKLSKIMNVSDVEKLNIVVEGTEKSVYVYNPDNHRCEILTKEFYQGYNDIEILSDAINNSLYYDDDLICSNFTTENNECNAYLDKNKELRLECDFYYFKLFDSLTVAFVDRTHKLRINAYDAISNQKISKANIEIINENTKEKNSFSTNIPYSTILKEGVYKIQVKDEAHNPIIKNIFLKKDMALNFYLLPLEQISKIKLRITKIYTDDNDVTVYGYVENADSCVIKEGKPGVYVPIAYVNTKNKNFESKFKAKATLDYVIECKNRFDFIRKPLLSNFKVNNPTTATKKSVKRNVYFTEIIKNIKYGQKQFVSLDSFWKGLEKEVKKIIEKLFYATFYNATKMLVDLNNRFVNDALFYAQLINKTQELDVYPLDLENNFTDLINIKQKLLIMEVNIKNIDRFLQKYKDQIKQYDPEFMKRFYIDSDYGKQIAYLDKYLPRKISTVKYVSYDQDVNKIKGLYSSLCLLDDIHLLLVYRVERKTLHLYRVNCPYKGGITILNESNVLGNKIKMVHLNDTTYYSISKPLFAFIPKQGVNDEIVLKAITEKSFFNSLSAFTGNFVKEALQFAVNKKKSFLLIFIFSVAILLLITLYMTLPKISNFSKNFSNKRNKKSFNPRLSLNLFNENSFNLDSNFMDSSIFDDLYSDVYGLRKSKKERKNEMKKSRKIRFGDKMNSIFSKFSLNLKKMANVIKLNTLNKSPKKKEKEDSQKGSHLKYYEQLMKLYREFKMSLNNSQYDKVNALALKMIKLIEKIDLDRLDEKRKSNLKKIESELYLYM